MFHQVHINKVRDYWNQRPCNLRHSKSEIGTRQYFDEVEARKYFVEPHIPGFAQFERWNGKKVLEIGCGIGTDTINFARAGARVTAIDISEESIKLARRRTEIFGLTDRITFYHASAEMLSSVVPSQPYDLVYSFGAIHHTPHPENVVAQIRSNYLQPGSVLKAMVYHRYSYKVLWILITKGQGAFWKLDQLIASHSEAQARCPVTYTYSRATVRKLFQDFQIQELRVNHIFPYRIPDYLQYRYRKEWYFRVLPSPLFRWLEHHYGWHLCVTATTP